MLFNYYDKEQQAMARLEEIYLNLKLDWFHIPKSFHS